MARIKPLNGKKLKARIREAKVGVPDDGLNAFLIERLKLRGSRTRPPLPPIMGGRGDRPRK